MLYKILPLILIANIGTVFAQVTVSTNATSKLKSYRFTENGFKLELIQRLPDQTRAFFMARGFSSTVANKIGLSCIFQGIGTNISNTKNPTAIEVSLKNWHVYANKKIQSIKMKETWNKEWAGSTVTNASKIAYKWATFPSYQNFANSGDYGWGMISFNLPPGTTFDLAISWKDNNKTHKAWMRSLECPNDR